MLIYDKNNDSIDIYSIQAKKEELKKFRRNVLQKHKDDQLFYRLKTNSDNTIIRFSGVDDIDIKFLDYDYSTPVDAGPWSNIEVMQNLSAYDIQTQKEILERYVEGDYSDLIPTRTYKFICQDDLECEIHRLLKPEKAKIISQNSRRKVWEVSNMINLPRNLYLLHLLEHGNFPRLISENITRQLQLFEIDYLKRINLSDIRDMIETGLVEGTIESAIKKAEIGSRILRKIEK